MKAEADKLRCDLECYWLLLDQISDEEVSKALRERIAEAEARLEAIALVRNI
jgi:hypothetical protein